VKVSGPGSWGRRTLCSPACRSRGAGNWALADDPAVAAGARGSGDPV